MLGRWLPFLTSSSDLKDIYNYLPIDDFYATSGQPSETQFQLIKAAGYKTIINLAPTSMLENSVIEERAILDQLGMSYIHIPVDFKNPTDQDFNKFVANVGEPSSTWVHCAANMRVSAFTYRYRTEVLGHSEQAAMEDLQQIWEPVGVWSEFIKK